jgi:hypothetical protein
VSVNSRPVWIRAAAGFLQERLRTHWPVVAVFLASAGALAWRVSSWPPSQSPDAWAYVAWGQALARGERPLYDRALTTPKPLGSLLGLLVSLLPPQRAFQTAVLVALAVTAAALFWAAYRQSGTLGATVALGALGLSYVVGGSLRAALIDAIGVALVMVALVTRGRVRLACLLVAGLARPEAWVLAAIAAYADASGGVRRRLIAGALAGAAAPIVWIGLDYALTGDPRATTHRARAIVDVTRGGETSTLASLPGLIRSGAIADFGLVVAVLGVVGVAIVAVRGVRSGRFDPLPPAVIVVWGLGIFAETGSVPFKERFLFPMAGPLLLGVAFVVAAPLAGRLRGPPLLAVVCASIAFVLGAGTMPTPTSHDVNLLRAIPTIGRALRCGTMDVEGHATSGITGHYPGAITPLLAAMTHRSLHRFLIGRSRRRFMAVFVLGHGPAPPGWPGRRFSFGTVAVSPACAPGLS